MRPNILAPETVSATCQSAGRVGFGFGRRFFFLMLVGVLWIIPAFWDLRLLLVMAAWDACVLIAWLTDLLRLPRAGYLKLERSWGGPAALNDPVAVRLHMENQS